MILPMQLLPTILKLGSRPFLRRLIDYTPLPDLWQARDLADTMEANSRNILKAKRAALEKGDAAVVERFGHGKDLMSLLSKCQSCELFNSSAKQNL